MNYTIIYQNTCGDLGLVSWLGSSFTSYEYAVKIGKSVCETLQEDMPNMTFFVLMHQFEWVTNYKDNPPF